MGQYDQPNGLLGQQQNPYAQQSGGGLLDGIPSSAKWGLAISAIGDALNGWAHQPTGAMARTSAMLGQFQQMKRQAKEDARQKQIQMMLYGSSGVPQMGGQQGQGQPQGQDGGLIGTLSPEQQKWAMVDPEGFAKAKMAHMFDEPKHSAANIEWQDYKDSGGTLGFNDYQTMDTNRKAPRMPGPDPMQIVQGLDGGYVRIDKRTGAVSPIAMPKPAFTGVGGTDDAASIKYPHLASVFKDTGTAGYSLPELDFAAHQLISGDQTPLTAAGAMGKAGGARKQALQKAMIATAVKEGVSPQQLAQINAEYFGTKSGLRAAGTQQAKMSIAGNEADQMFDLAAQSSEGVPRSDFTPLAQAELRYKLATSDPATNTYVANLTAAGNTWARAINPNGELTDSGRAAAHELFSPYKGHKALMAVLNAAKQETIAARKSPGQFKSRLMQEAIGGQAAETPSEQTVGTPTGGWTVKRVK